MYRMINICDFFYMSCNSHDSTQYCLKQFFQTNHSTIKTHKFILKILPLILFQTICNKKKYI